MRILIISPGYPPTAGGVEAVVAAVASRLSNGGLDVEVWAQDRSVRRAEVRMFGGLRVRLFPTTSSLRFGVSWRLWFYALRHIREADLVHAHSYHVASCLTGLLAPSSTPVVFTPHFHGRGHTRLARALHPVYQFAAERLVERASSVVAVSEAEAVLLTSTFPQIADRCTVIRNAVDVADIHSAIPYSGQPPTLLVLGRLERYKRVDTIIEQFGSAKRPGQLVIVGDGPEFERLSAFAQASPRAIDIRMLGYLDRSEVTRWLRTARGLVSMSQHEAFGIAAMEAIAAGASVLLSELPAHREVASFAPAGVVKLISAQSGTLSIELDELLERPGEQPRRIRDWSAVVEEHTELYRALLK